jgi:hypothetical protein
MREERTTTSGRCIGACYKLLRSRSVQSILGEVVMLKGTRIAHVEMLEVRAESWQVLYKQLTRLERAMLTRQKKSLIPGTQASC